MPARWEITRAVRRSELASSARLIMLVLCDIAEAGTAEIPAHRSPSLTVLCDETGLTKRTVQTYLADLEEGGWISRSRPESAEAMWRGERVRYQLSVPNGLVQESPDPEATIAPAVDNAPDVQVQPLHLSGATTAPLEKNLKQPSQEPSSSGIDTPDPHRPDVEKICRHLADRIVANGSKRPTITAKWRTEARLLLDKDGRTVEQVIKAIDWCQADPFWHGNILSMPTLRQQYDKLRLAAQRNGTARASPASTAPEAVPPDQRCPEHPNQHADSCRDCRARRLAKPKGAR